MYAGEYIATCEGYFETTVMVQADNGAVTVNFSQPIATTQSNEITIKEDKTIAIKGNGVADRNNHRDISADLKMTDEQINSTGLTLEFTVRVTNKYRNGDDWAASRFGVQIGEGAVGFFVFIRDNGTNNADVVKLNANSLDLNPGTEHKWHGDDPDLNWLTVAALSEGGLQMKVVRVNGVIHIYAKNGENWVLLDTQETTNGEGNTSGGDLTIANSVRNQIKFIATGDDWEFSNISITLPEETEKAALTASVDNEEHGSIATDIQSYYKGDKAVITVTAVKGYQLDKLVIGNTEVTEGWTKEGLVYTYELTLEGDTTVVANIIETPIPQVTPNITVSGAKYGSTETPDIAEGLEITLTNEDMETEYKGTVDANGKITFEKQLYVATYTVTAQGYFSTTVTITEDTAEAIELTLYVETVDCEITVGETGDTAKFVAEGATVTFSKDGVTKTVMVTDGKVKLEDVLTGNWVTTANFGGYEIDLGWTTVDKSGTASITVDADGIMWSKAEKPIVSSDIAEGTVEIVTNVAYHNKIKLATQKEGGALAFRLALPDSVDTTGNFRTAMSMPITFADGNMVFVFFAEKNGETNTIKLGYTSVNGGEWWDDADRLNLSAQWETFIDGGLWIVVDVNANTSLVRTYVGATLETAVNANYDRTYKGNSKQLTAFEIGNGGYEKDDSNRNILVTFKYGETLSALNVGSEITLAKVNAEVTVGGTDDKYTAEGATLVFNHVNGVYSAEGTVTNGKVALTDIPVGNYKVGAKVNGLIVDLGGITVAEGDTDKTIALEAKPVFDPKKEQDYAGYNLAEGTFEIITNETYHNKISFAQAGNGGALAFKFALPAGADANGDFKAVTSMPLNFASGDMWIVLRLEKSGDTKVANFGYTSVEGGEWWGKDGDGYLDLSAQWDTIVNGGLWVVADIDAASGAIKTYTGATLDGVQDANYNRTVKSANRTIVALEIGNAVEVTNTNLCITLAYGETLEALKTEGDSQSSDTPAQD